MKIRIVVTGRSYPNTGRMPEQLDLPDSATVDDAIAAVERLLPDQQPLASSCLVAVSGRHLGTVARHEPKELAEGDELVLIAPVAGG